MQRLEVSGAVRPIYGSLGVKRLILCCFTLLLLFSLENVIYEGNCCSEFFDDRMLNDESQNLSHDVYCDRQVKISIDN